MKTAQEIADYLLTLDRSELKAAIKQALIETEKETFTETLEAVKMAIFELVIREGYPPNPNLFKMLVFSISDKGKLIASYE